MFEVSDPNAILYAWSEATSTYEPLVTHYEDGRASAEILELSLVLVGTCPATRGVCSGRCVALANDEAHCGACGHVCETSQICWEAAYRDAAGESCAILLPISSVEDVSPNARASADILHAAPDVVLPSTVAHLVRRGSSHDPVADRVWTWTPAEDFQAALRAELVFGDKIVKNDPAFGVYRDGCAPEQLLGAVSRDTLRFGAVAGATYYFVAFADIPDRNFT